MIQIGIHTYTGKYLLRYELREEKGYVNSTFSR